MATVEFVERIKKLIAAKTPELWALLDREGDLMSRGYLLVALYISTVAWAQTAPTDIPSKTIPITFGFFAVDRDNRPYADLKQSDLTILENKRPARPVLSVKKGSELPLRLGLLIDASNSQRRSALYGPALLAATDFLNHILQGPDDEAFVEKVTAEHEASEFMNMAQLRGYSLEVAPQGGTALYDGIGYACDSRMRTDEPRASRRVLIVLSDGEDNLSGISPDTAIAKALKAGVVIFAVSTADDSRSRHSMIWDAALKHLAEETGGEAFLNLNRKKVEQSFSAITEAISNMYFVTFEPADASEKGLHRIELKVSGNNNIRLRAPKAVFHDSLN